MPYNDRLFHLLWELDNEELAAIWCDALKRDLNDDNFGSAVKDGRVGLISQEWRSAHGHSLLNLRRSAHELPWKRILVDVADKLAPGWGWTHYSMNDYFGEEDIERDILRMYDARLKNLWQKLSPEEKIKLAQDVDAGVASSVKALGRQSATIAARGVTVSALGQGISAGLLTGGGLVALAQGSLSFAVGGVFGGVLQQLGFWMAVQMMGVFAGTRFALGGGASLLGGAVVSAPIGAAFVAHTFMSTSYRKSIPATIMLLSSIELRHQLALLEV